MELGLVNPPCGPTTHRSVSSLELWGDHLGMVVAYVFEGLSGISQTEVRLDAVSSGASREVSYLLSGMAGQLFSMFPSPLATRLTSEHGTRRWAFPWASDWPPDLDVLTVRP